MIKTDIVREVAKSLDMKEVDCLEIVDATIDSIKETIAEHHRLEIRDFGVFQVKTRKARVGRNPRNKVEYPIPERKVLTFQPGKELKKRLEVPQSASLE